MSVFTLATFYLTTFNLPWFMDLTFQALMQYYSLWHHTLLSPPDTSTAGHCFCFGSASSFLLELFLPSSPVAYWTSTNLGGAGCSSFSVISFCLCILFKLHVYMGALKDKHRYYLQINGPLGKTIENLNSLYFLYLLKKIYWLLSNVVCYLSFYARSS